MADDYDVIIVGSGAGGGTLAHRLAPSGKRVLILERGDWLPREPQNWDATDVFVKNRYVSKDTWYDKDGKAFQPQVHYFVGGATKFYGAALYRLREQDFGELQHHGGISPAWPISYNDMAPYYAQAEELYQVHGLRGEDPSDPPGDPYPFPPVSHEPRIQQLFDDLARVGLHPFHSPNGIMLNEANPAYSPCIRSATCDGFACLLHAKSDAEVIAVRPVAHCTTTSRWCATPRCCRLETDPSGRTVTSVVAEVDGVEQRFTGSIVVVVGRRRELREAAARQRERQRTRTGSRTGPTRSDATTSSTTAGHSSPSRCRRTTPASRRPSASTTGTSATTTSSTRWAMCRWSASPHRRCTGARSRSPNSRREFALNEMAEHAVDFWLSTEDLPVPENRVTLGKDGNVVLELHAEQPRAARPALQPGEEAPQPPGHAPPSPDPP